jgi:anthranilate phosphoribosyltransferase
VVELRDGEVRDYTVDPKELGIATAPTEALVGGDPATNAELGRRVLAGDAGPHRDVVCLNAAAGLVVAGLADDLTQGLQAAQAAIDGGDAADALDRLVAVSHG